MLVQWLPALVVLLVKVLVFGEFGEGEEVRRLEHESQRGIGNTHWLELLSIVQDMHAKPQYVISFGGEKMLFWTRAYVEAFSNVALSGPWALMQL